MAAQFTINGEEYDFVEYDDLTFREQRKMKRLSGGMSPAELSSGVPEGDPDALQAWLTVCMQRVNPDIADDVLDEIAILTVLEESAPAEDEDEEGLRPTNASGDGGSGKRRATRGGGGK